ncbi:MAG: iron-containing alcohol dehydrogenase family protein [Cyanobacteriota bacterium]|nr:iron-containing alcohol dehydrogenase family protein [Cyanobacteriota bacterium]
MEPSTPAATADPDVSRPPRSSWSHTIAPALVIRGQGVWPEAIDAIQRLSQRPLLLGRGQATFPLRQQLLSQLREAGLAPGEAALRHDCCEEDLRRLRTEVARSAREGAHGRAAAAEGPYDGVIAMGGGKVLDAGKLLAHRLGLPCVTVPTSAATCAGWTALSNIYTSNGAFVEDVGLARCPELLVFDHDLVRQAPPRTLISGMADAMAKWYEASVSSGQSSDGLVQQAVQQARLLRDLMLLEGAQALEHPGSQAWARVAEGAALTAGLIGGLGGARCRTVAAHAVHNGLTQLPATHSLLHGEKVGFGILVQLRLEEVVGGSRLAGQARQQLLDVFRALGVPCTLADLGLAEATLSDLQQVVEHACRDSSDLHHLPFPVTVQDVLAALVSTTTQTQPVA